MGLFSRIVKAVKKPLLGAAKVGLSAVTGGLSDKAIALGGAIKKAGKVRKAAKALSKLPKLQVAQIKYDVPAPNVAQGVEALNMPGGMPLRAKAPKRRKAKATKAAPKKTGAKRTPPKGGLNLAALGASWRAAGKPGTWKDWVKRRGQ